MMTDEEWGKLEAEFLSDHYLCVNDLEKILFPMIGLRVFLKSTRTFYQYGGIKGGWVPISDEGIVDCIREHYKLLDRIEERKALHDKIHDLVWGKD